MWSVTLSSSSCLAFIIAENGSWKPFLRSSANPCHCPCFLSWLWWCHVTHVVDPWTHFENHEIIPCFSLECGLYLLPHVLPGPILLPSVCQVANFNWLPFFGINTFCFPSSNSWSKHNLSIFLSFAGKQENLSSGVLENSIQYRNLERKTHKM